MQSSSFEREVGRKGGLAAYENRVGAHARSLAQMQADGRKGRHVPKSRVQRQIPGGEAYYVDLPSPKDRHVPKNQIKFQEMYAKIDLLDANSLEERIHKCCKTSQESRFGSDLHVHSTDCESMGNKQEVPVSEAVFIAAATEAISVVEDGVAGNFWNEDVKTYLTK
ncbi:expressed unknown protein [Seminavis robusta]|uniref:Uncharacterized protein n=1 Tax=Seminavis robusta TaxID=568900 RepID=A0A9N8HJ85_9STRA|nr:expressed unknown protein [Seminavis robusta]|eukprot:Sro644_g180440.1 n/a (166) ;mRNA; r:10918-11582